MLHPQYLLDFSLALINRTGAYVICHDILQEMPEFFPQVRYWRLLRKEMPKGLIRRIAGRLMLYEMMLLRDRAILSWPDGQNAPKRRRLILDPLYVLRSRLAVEDIVLCHDIGPVSHPALYGGPTLYQEAYEKIRRVGPGMVFVSDATQQAFRQRYGERFRFLQTVAQYVRPGVLTGSTEPVPGVKPPFLLTVGALEMRKNHLRVLDAYEQSGLHARGIGYVFCGSRHHGAEAIVDKASRTPGVTALGYTHLPDRLVWMPDAREAVRDLNDAGYFVFVVTNQAGIARGLYDEAAMAAFHGEMARQLADAGAHIDAFYHCPFHPAARIACYAAANHPDRKPNPGMILRACKDWPVRLNGSFLIGDRDSDIEAASRAGLPGLLYRGGSLRAVAAAAMRASAPSQQAPGGPAPCIS